MAQIYQPNTPDQPIDLKADNTTRRPNPSTFSIVIVYASFILIIPIFMFIGKRNSFMRLQTRINEAASGIDVQLKNRRDTLIKLVDATKGSMKFEKDVLTQITELRTAKITPENRTNVDNQLNTIGRSINVAFENYPQLRSVEAVKQLMDSSYSIEQEIAATRRLYNSYVRDFNAGLFTWPSNVVANSLKLETLPMFQTDSASRQDVEIKLQ